MISGKLSCPKCQGRMEEGFVKDSTYGGMTTGEWVEGKPERSIWTGLKLKGKKRIVIVMYRCERCGYLESYAR